MMTGRSSTEQELAGTLHMPVEGNNHQRSCAPCHEAHLASSQSPCADLAEADFPAPERQTQCRSRRRTPQPIDGHTPRLTPTGFGAGSFLVVVAAVGGLAQSRDRTCLQKRYRLARDIWRSSTDGHTEQGVECWLNLSMTRNEHSLDHFGID